MALFYIFTWKIPYSYSFVFGPYDPLFDLPEAKYLPKGEKATECVQEWWPFELRILFAQFTSHSLIVLSEEPNLGNSIPEAKKSPEEEKATEFTSPECPLNWEIIYLV